MNDPEKFKLTKTKVEIAAGSVGLLIVGAVCKQPGLVAASIGVGGVEVASLASDFLDFLDMRESRDKVIASAMQTLAESND